MCLFLLIAAQITILPGRTEETQLETKILKAKALLQTGISKWEGEEILKAKDIFIGLLMNQEQKKAQFHYYVALCGYRLATYYMTSNSMTEAQTQASDAEKHLEKAVELEPSWGEPYALYATLMGIEIAFDMNQAMTLSIKSNQYFKKALELEPENPRINLLKGVSVLYTPEQYGGGAEAAKNILDKSVSLFEKENIQDPLMPSWGKDEAYTFIAMAYNLKGESEKARDFFKKALDINPELRLAQDELKKLGKK